ncbi:MAG: acyltransferase [Bradyrhizobium sp.]|uniref:acyltransferase family protein n=1 Tax=Bradyrhizobium sp. TaxID=376 RepID=UPI0011FA1832|nr:acyltransferase [Bradyrhizobium sp.]THD68709.1 MAG: acyltransferase [Bradyrhizobium sp.]
MRERLPSIELLRFILALLVVIYHYFYFGAASGVLSIEPIGVSVLPYFVLAVDTFFIVSGFVILFSAEKRSCSAFVVSRFARLGPALLVCSTITLCAITFSGSFAKGTTFIRWLASITVLPLTFANGLDRSLWSLRYEIIFYAIVAGVVWRGLTYKRIALVAYFLIALNAVYIVRWSIADRMLMQNFGSLFALGIFLYVHRNYRIPLVAWIICALVAFMTCVVEVSRVAGLLHQPMQWTGTAIASVVTIGAFPAFLLMQPKSEILIRLCALAGRASYPLYVLHQTAGYVVITWLLTIFPAHALAIQIVTLLGMIGFATLFSSLIEPQIASVYRMAGFYLEDLFGYWRGNRCAQNR